MLSRIASRVAWALPLLLFYGGLTKAPADDGLVTVTRDAASESDDWPMWRCDAQRSAATAHELPESLRPIWKRQFSRRTQAWDDPLNLDLMTYDRVFEPIVMDGRLFVGFNDRDKLSAFDAATGDEIWSFFAEAPVRLPPVGWRGRVFFVSDDGHLYCVDAADGKLIWKFSGAPSAQHAVGNRRLTSAWPARGGPVVRDQTVYFTASIWPFMGTFVYALDADSGAVRWVNDSTGAQYIKQPHSAPSFAGVAPQGALVATESLLLVPGGRSVPAAFDRSDGRLRYFELNAGGKGTGGSFVIADDRRFYVHTRSKGTRAFKLNDGVKTAFQPNEPVLADGMVYSAEVRDETPVIRAYDASDKEVWSLPVDGRGDLILAGHRLYAAGEDAITVIRLPVGNSPAMIEESIALGGRAERLLAASDKLFAVMLDGTMVALGNGNSHSEIEPLEDAIEELAVQPSSVVDDVLEVADAQGYAFWFGPADDPVLESLASSSPFEQLAVVDHQADRIDVFRRKIDRAGRYGRVTAHHSDAATFLPPQYVANLVVVASEVASQWTSDEIERVYAAVRPYGGVMYLLAGEGSSELASKVESIDLEQARVDLGSRGVIVRRVGALPGSADWTHQYGDIANTLKSDDQRVKLPLGVLWFGGSSHMDVLPRHGHGPPEQVVGGRLFIQGTDCLSARDVYTGRVLWKRVFEGLDTFDVYYDSTFEDLPLNTKYNQVHIPGANGRGTNYVVTEDRVYLIEGNVCHAIDPATGETLHDIRLPETSDGESPVWGYIGVYEDVLIGGLGFAMYRGRHGLEFDADKKLSRSKAGFGSKSLDRAASRALVGFDRHTGEMLWRVDAKHSFWHNGIVAGGGKVFCLDKNPLQIEQAMLRRGRAIPDSYRIVALNYRSGDAEWEVDEGVFGTWLGYSSEHDLLLQAGAKASDRLYAEVAKGMAVYSAKDGRLRWRNDDRQYAGPCILHNDLIITNANSYTESSGAFYLQDGTPKLVENPLTGEKQPWKITRAYGCNNIIASENMLTFRSGAAGFYDLLSESGTGNLGGFKSGCTSNLVVAGGVLNAPDYTRTCSCAYQNQTSLALVHMPGIDVWTVNTAIGRATHGKPINRLGINFGAPGHRRDPQGTVWIEHPQAVNASVPITISMNAQAEPFRHHSSSMTATEMPWLYASGVEAVTDIRVAVKLDEEYTLSRGVPIMHVNDDSEESERGAVDLRSGELDLVDDSGAQRVGLRFDGINIARGTKIRSASIQFTSSGKSTSPSSLIVTAEDTADAAEFTKDSHDLSSRTPTSAEVGWEPKPWGRDDQAGEAQRTPDLSSLVQAVVDREDWKPGSAMAFLISGTGTRVAKSSQRGPRDAPRLIIDAELVEPEGRPAGGVFDLRLFFGAPTPLSGGKRVFDVSVEGERIANDVTIDPDGDADDRIAVVALKGVSLSGSLNITLHPKEGQPVISGLEVVRQPSR